MKPLGTQEYCPKCGQPSAHARLTWMGNWSGSINFIRVECSRCGYFWEEEALDYKEKDERIVPQMDELGRVP